MATRRSFTFGSLLLAVGAGRARAGTPVEPLHVDVHAARTPGRLEVRLTLHNRGKSPVEVMLGAGSGPGPWVRAHVDVGDQTVIELDRHHEKGLRKLVTSRLGPIPRWGLVAAGASETLEPYPFVWPDTLPERATVTLRVEIETGRGTQRLTREILPDPPPGKV